MVDDKTEEMLRSHALVRRNIEKHGQHIWSVSVAEHDLLGSFPFAYTVGNYERGFPELLITGPVADSYGVVFNMLSKLQSDRGRGFHHGEEVSLGGKYPIRILEAGHAGRIECATFIRGFYDTDIYEVRQVLVCDPNGRWPWDPECASGYSDQPIMNRSTN